MKDHDANVEKAIVAQLSDPQSALIQRVTRNNQILLHNYRVEAVKTCHCPLPGCGEPFEITLIPNQVLYPKFCDAHRTEYRREFHLQQLALEPAAATKNAAALSPVSTGL